MFLLFLILFSIPFKIVHEEPVKNVSRETIQQPVCKPIEDVKREEPKVSRGRVYELPPVSGEFKTYMDYRTITDISSKQYKLQQQAITNEIGIREINGRLMVAMGTYYVEKVGKKFDITLSTGEVIPVIVGDIKSDLHTDPTNRYIQHNGNIVEFIVNEDILDRKIKLTGSLNHGKLKGQVTKIQEVLED
mgnify:CR=1 FL=1